MSSFRTQQRTPDDPRSGADRAPSAISKALAWLALVAVAVFPFPWWW